MYAWLNNALYGWYPYVALTVFFARPACCASDHSQYTMADRLQPVAAPAAVAVGIETCSTSAS